MRATLWLSAFVVGALAFGACSASDSSSSPSSAVDSGGSDSSVDAPADSTTDSTTDSTADSTTDSTTDSSPDAPLSDASADVVVDASACTLTKPYSSSNPTCNACAEQHCCEAVNACYADPDCDDGYVNCALACALLPDDAGDAGNAGCLAECGTQYPIGKTEYDAAIGCADASCAVECQ